MSSILLFGKNGQVGWELCRTMQPLGTVVAVDFPEVDFTQPDTLVKWIRDVTPVVIVNAAAYTAVDKAESEPQKAMAINGIAPGILAKEARKLGALLLHYSTDYVFDGTKTGPYTEADPPNPVNAYGRSKLAGDQTIQQVNGNYLIFRCCWIYGARGHNFLNSILRLAREREKLRVVNDQVGAPTWSRMIAETTALVLAKMAGASTPLQAGSLPTEFKGLYHLAASGSTSWHGFAQAIVDRLPAAERKCRVVEPITTPDYPTPARRPANSVISCDKLRQAFGLSCSPWQTTLDLAWEEIWEKDET